MSKNELDEALDLVDAELKRLEFQEGKLLN